MTPTQRGVEHGPVAMPTPGWTNACRGCDKTWPHPTQPTPREVPVREAATISEQSLGEALHHWRHPYHTGKPGWGICDCMIVARSIAADYLILEGARAPKVLTDLES